MSDLKLTPSLLSMLERIERNSGTLLMLAVATDAVGSANTRSRAARTLAGPPVSCRTLAHEPCLFRRIPARFLAPERSGCHPVVAFGIGTRLAAERDPHAALRVSRDWRSGGAMGLWFQRHGGPYSPTLGLVRALGIANRAEVADRGGRSPSISESTAV